MRRNIPSYIRPSIGAILLALALQSCTDSSAPPPQPPVTPIDPSQTGSVHVSVTYQGPIPDPVLINMSSAGGCAALHKEPVYEQRLRAPGGHLANALVYIKSGFGNRAFTFPTDPVVLDQRGCLYHPHVVGVMVGQPLEFHNSDPEAHNVRGRPSVVGGWNFLMSRPDSRRTLYFEKPEVGIRVGCDIHPWMSAFVSVLSNPFFAVTPDSGAVTLQGIPAGDYVVGAWHEVLGEREQKVTVTAKGEANIEIAYPPQS